MGVKEAEQAIVDIKYRDGTSSTVKINGPFRTEVVSPNVDIDKASYEELANKAGRYASEINEQAGKFTRGRLNPAGTDPKKTALMNEENRFSELATKLTNVKEAIDSDEVVKDANAKIRQVEEAVVDDELNAAVRSAQEEVDRLKTEGEGEGDALAPAAQAAAVQAAAVQAAAEALERAEQTLAAAKAAAVEGVGTVEELNRLKRVVAEREAEATGRAGAAAVRAKNDAIPTADEALEAARAVKKLFNKNQGDPIYNNVNERIDFALKVKNRMEKETGTTRPSEGGALTSRVYVAKKRKPYTSNNVTNKLKIIKPKAKKSRVANLKLNKLNRKLQEYSKKIRNLKKISRRVTHKKR